MAEIFAPRKIAVGSKNPVKIKAVEAVVKKFWPDAEIVSVDAESGVSEQPLSDEEAIEGAKNRARQALEKTGADIGIGNEALAVDSEYGMFLSGWAAAIGKNGKIGIGNGGRFLIPEAVAEDIRKGMEVGPAMDKLTCDHNIKQKQGAVGVFTKGLLTRAEAAQREILYALVRFVSQEYYD